MKFYIAVPEHGYLSDDFATFMQIMQDSDLRAISIASTDCSGDFVVEIDVQENDDEKGGDVT